MAMRRLSWGHWLETGLRPRHWLTTEVIINPLRWRLGVSLDTVGGGWLVLRYGYGPLIVRHWFPSGRIKPGAIPGNEVDK